MPAPQPIGLNPLRSTAIQACASHPTGASPQPVANRSPFDAAPPMGLNFPESPTTNPTGNNPADNNANAPGQDNNQVTQVLIGIIEHLMQLLMNKAQNAGQNPAGESCDGSSECNHCNGDNGGVSPVSANGPSAAGSIPRQGPVSGAAPAGNAPGVGPLPSEPTGGPVQPSSDLTRFPGVNDPRLQEHINRLATDPEGSNLLKEAKRRGVRIEVGQVDEGTLAHFNPNENKIVIGEATMRSGTGMQSLIHELVHATTPHDGDSQHEEGMANVIANRISSRINGRRADNPAGIYNSTLNLYPELAGTNPGFDNNINRVLRGGSTAERRPRFQTPALSFTA